MYVKSLPSCPNSDLTAFPTGNKTIGVSDNLIYTDIIKNPGIYNQIMMKR